MLYTLLSFLVFFILGLPYLIVFPLSRKKVQEITLEIVVLTAAIGPLLVNFLILVLGYANLLTREILLLTTIIVAIMPFFSKNGLSSLTEFFNHLRTKTKKLKSLGNMKFNEAFPLSLILSVMAITSFSAFTRAPVLRDPYAVWLFYGKKIMETKTIPLYYGNAPDISWSGNYPPLISFLASYYFIILGKAPPEAFTHISWLYGGLTLLATFLLAKELGLNREYALLSASLLTTASIFTLELVNYGYVTIGWSFYITASCIYMIRCIKEETLHSSLLFGLCFGAALLSTYLSFIYAASIILLIVGMVFFKKFKQKNFSPKVKPLCIGLTISLTITLPWLLRNYLLLGNPVYPWFYQIFGGKGIVSDIINMIPQPKYNLKDLLTDNTFYAMANEDIGYTLLFLGSVSAFYLALCKKVELSFMGLLTIVSFTLFIVLMNLHYGYERYLLMAAPLLAVSAGYLLSKVFSSKENILKVLIIISIAIFSAPNYIHLSTLAISGAPAGETLLLNPIMCYIDNYTPSCAVILTNEIQLYFINRPAINVYNLPAVFKAKSLTELMDSLKSYNITHILINKDIDPEVLGNTPLFLALNECNDNFRILIDMYPYELFEVVYNDG
jgi:hypothetical protein